MKSQSMLFSLIPIVFVAVVIIHEKFRQKKIRSEYDEMQLAIRAKGAWYGLYALVLYWAACFVAEYACRIRFLSAAYAVFFGLMITASVTVGYSIWHDSYYGMNWSGSRNLYFLCLIGAIEVICILILIAMIREGAFADLKVPCEDERLMMVLCIPMFTTILVVTLLRRLHPEQEEA